MYVCVHARACDRLGIGGIRRIMAEIGIDSGV